MIEVLLVNDYLKRQTVFDRPIDIYIQNNTDKDFTLFKTELQSGMIYSNAQPPKLIKAGGKGYFKGDQTGLVGSSGFVTYNTKLGNTTVYLTFYWSHPEGNTDSIYYGYSSPFGLFFVTPKDNYNLSHLPTNQKFKVKDWITNEYSEQNVLTLNPPEHISQSVTYLIQYSLGHKAV
ncbi:hypothetical protein IRP62_05055 [Clostridium botulinum]|nr:hypothetical protein [Clostridium haemolyticum]QPW54211.1 hypothetical protein IRP62_05055 [Clostridium botulinum]QPW56362.1 hypothetical protein IRP61_04950 [Clostridium botulinum]